MANKHLPRNTYQCPHCEFKASTNCQLMLHIKKVHEKIEGNFICQVCSRKFLNQGLLNQHMKIHLGTNRLQTIPCQFCDKMFAAKYLLKRHILSIHNNCKTQYLCHLCPKSFPAEFKLNIHIRTIHRQRFQCPKCSFSCKSRDFFKRHNEALHLGWRYRCVYPGCDLDYMHKKDILKHVILHHTKDPAEIERCKIYLRNLQHHVIDTIIEPLNGKFDGRSKIRK